MENVIPVERLHRASILVVDDVEMNRRMLSHSLSGHGYGNVLQAVDGAQALQMTRDFNPDLVILDLMMPGMDGFAYCQSVRQDRAFDNTPIIVQTAIHEMEQKLRAFQLGASDYICKPIDPGELIARTQVHLSQKLMMEDLRNYRKRVSAELDSARSMQNRLMPTPHQVQICERVFDMKIAAHFETSSALGGDCWGMRPLSDSRLAIWMYDFSGHGITAAMNVFRMHTIMQEFMHTGGEPGNFLTMLNRHLHSLLEREEFATMFYSILDTQMNCLLYAAAAVPPPLLYTGSDNELVQLNGRGFPLGVVANATYDTKYTPFAPGDLLLLYSDGIIETRNAAGKYLETEQMHGALRQAGGSDNPAEESVNQIVRLFKSHSALKAADDITVNAYWRCA